MADARQCTATKVDGSPCLARALPGGDRCLFHEPARAAQRDAGRKAGGRQRSKPAAVLPEGTADLPLATMADVLAALGATVNQVRRGTIDTKVGNCVGYLLATVMKALEGSDLARQLDELRRQVAEVQARGPGSAQAGSGATADLSPGTDGAGESVGDSAAPGSDAGHDGGGDAPRRVATGVVTIPFAEGVTPLFPTVG